LCGCPLDGPEGTDTGDRVDALVWARTRLFPKMVIVSAGSKTWDSQVAPRSPFARRR